MYFVRLNHFFSFFVLVIRGGGANVAPSGALEIANYIIVSWETFILVSGTSIFISVDEEV